MRDIKTAFLWETGRRDGVNQDSISLQQVKLGRNAAAFAVVCDGVGGLEEGETASGYVAEELTEWFYRQALPKGRKLLKFYGKRLAPYFTYRMFRHAVSRQLYRQHRALQEYGEGKGLRLGTTVTVCLLWNRFFLWAQTGDSRLYRIGNRSSRLTRDDTAAGCLTRCIGAGAWKRPETGRGYLRRGQLLLLCSDGFYRRLPRARMREALLGEKGMDKRVTCRQLERRLEQTAGRLMERGEFDNISAVCLLWE